MEVKQTYVTLDQYANQAEREGFLFMPAGLRDTEDQFGAIVKADKWRENGEQFGRVTLLERITAVADVKIPSGVCCG